MSTDTAQYWTSTGNRVRCELCPHGCTLQPGETGTCGVRTNRSGIMELPFFGAISSLAIDPIEKKPLYHFYPGTTVFSAGFLGCNLRCPFCQNFTISQSTHRQTTDLHPTALVSQAVDAGSFAIAYTYNEPTIHIEYVKECARKAREANLKNVLVTNGNILEEPARDLLAVIDAANIDLKGFDSGRYRGELGGDLGTVKRFITNAVTETHVEITTLLIPGFNDGKRELTDLFTIIADLDPEIPLHISAYYPTYKYSTPATTAEQVDAAVGLARGLLTHVYPGNVGGTSVTRCGECGAVLVERQGYRVDTRGLAGNRCGVCDAAAPFVMN